MSANSTGYILSKALMTQNSNFALNANIGEFFGFGLSTSNSGENTRFNTSPMTTTLVNFLINLSSGAHDAVMTITLSVDGTDDATRVITIPASGGAAILSMSGSTPVEIGTTTSYHIEGGGGAGTTSMKGYSQEFN